MIVFKIVVGGSNERTDTDSISYSYQKYILNMYSLKQAYNLI